MMTISKQALAFSTRSSSQAPDDHTNVRELSHEEQVAVAGGVDQPNKISSAAARGGSAL
jgi:hypothetical protein